MIIHGVCARGSASMGSTTTLSYEQERLSMTSNGHPTGPLAKGASAESRFATLTFERTLAEPLPVL